MDLSKGGALVEVELRAVQFEDMEGRSLASDGTWASCLSLQHVVEFIGKCSNRQSLQQSQWHFPRAKRMASRLLP